MTGYSVAWRFFTPDGQELTLYFGQMLELREILDLAIEEAGEKYGFGRPIPGSSPPRSGCTSSTRRTPPSSSECTGDPAQP